MMNHKMIRTMSAALAVAFVLVAIPASAVAQDRRTLATKVADILAQFPAASGAQRDRLAADMLALGDAGIAEFTRQLVPAGTGNDTAVRFALNAVAVYASDFGSEAKRAVAERALVTALGGAPDPEVRTFLLSQLRLVGRDEAVKAAAPLLGDATLSEPATQLMLSVRSVSARQALVTALPTATGSARITIVKALGDPRIVQAAGRDDITDVVLPLATNADAGLRKVALATVARIASPKAYNTLVSAAKAAGYRYEPSNATAMLLDYARNIGNNGDLKSSDRICRLVMKACTDAERLPTGAAALAILVDLRGHDALPDLLRAVDHPDKAYRNAALARAQRIAGIAALRQWIAKAQQVNGERRAEIIAMLGRQGDRAAVPFLRSSLSAPDADVSLAAAEALAHVLHADATPDLLSLLASGRDDAGRVAGILMWTIDERHLDPLAAMLDTLPAPAKASAIGVIAARGGRRFGDRIFALTADSAPEVRAAAFAGLAGVARASDVTNLLRLLDDAAEPRQVADVQKGLVAAVTDIREEQQRATPLVAALASSHPERIVEILPQVGGAKALAAVVEQYQSPDATRKAAAFRALVQWKGHDAASRLFTVVAAKDATFRDEAFSGFVRQIAASSLPADQKLLQFRKALDVATTTAERRMVLRAVDRVKTFQAMLVAASYLDDKELANDAAGVVMRIAMPSSGAHDGLSGRVVREALDKVLQVLSGPESEYDKTNIRTYLASMPKGDGFVPLFNGRDLTGWQGLVENPIARAKMTPQELAARQVEADKKVRANWSVRDAMIVFNGSGDNLCTLKEYGDFEMLVDWRITKEGDSGIYLRGSPQVQIWDPARLDVGAQVGSGGLYNNQKNPSKPLERADNPVGEWNTFRITMVGEKVTVFLNGVKVVDNVTLENYWDRKIPIFSRGPIELQAHGTDLAFRDVYVRDISEAEYSVTDEERADNFVSLFNGRTLDGWIGNVDGYKVEDGVMVYHPELGNKANLFTANEYGDFHLKFDFQLTPGANSGVGIRAPLEGDAAYVGMEIQVLDDTASIYASLQPYQYHGSIYGVIPAKRGFLKPVGEWNSEEIVARGSRIRVILNGTVIVDGDILEASRNGTIDHQQHPGLERSAGHIGWLSHDSVVRFRNVRIKSIAPGTQP